MSGTNDKRRSLILAGGGVKVAFQAGVLQVWLDEAGLKFDHFDAASGGLFNLCMLCQGMTGTQIADNWRNLDPRAGVDFNWSTYIRLFHAESLFELDAYRKKVFPKWGLDFDKINRADIEATFNVYNFTDHKLEVLSAAEMDEDFLVAGVSLPMWFPPVEKNNKIYIDSVFLTDGNLIEAARRGADEIWVIWTVGETSEWKDGFVNQYFQIIETAANGNYRRDKGRIEENNQRARAGEPSEFGKEIAIHELKSEVGLHYLINFSKDRVGEAVNLGVQEGRKFCERNGIGMQNDNVAPALSIEDHPTTLSFTETMRGFVDREQTDYDLAYRAGKSNKERLDFTLTIEVDGVNRFVTDPMHEARATGHVEGAIVGGKRPVENGVFNLFIDEGDRAQKWMRYRLWFRDDQDRELTLAGFKDVKDDKGFDTWSDTTTLYVRLVEGHVDWDTIDDHTPIAYGILRIHMRDFLRQLTTFRTTGPSLMDRSAAMGSFGKLFLGDLWEVYARDILPNSPF